MFNFLHLIKSTRHLVLAPKPREHSIALTVFFLILLMTGCHSDQDLESSRPQGLIGVLKKSDDAIPALSHTRMSQLIARASHEVRKVSSHGSPQEVRLHLAKEIINFIEEEGGIKIADIRKIFASLVGSANASDINLTRVLGYNKDQTEIPLLDLADAVAYVAQKKGYKEPLKTFHATLGASEVVFKEKSIEDAVRGQLAKIYPYIDWRDRPLREFSTDQVEQVFLSGMLDNAPLLDLKSLPSLKRLQVEIRGPQLIQTLVHLIPALKKLDSVYICTFSANGRAEIGHLLPLGKMSQIKTLGLNTDFVSPSTMNSAENNPWADLSDYFPHVNTVAVIDSWANRVRFPEDVPSASQNLSLLVSAINSMPRVQTLELHSNMLGRQLGNLPAHLKFATIRLRNRSGIGRHPLDTSLDIGSLGRPFSKAKSLTIYNFGITDSGKFHGSSNANGKNAVDWEELVILKGFAPEHSPSRPYTIRLWPKLEPSLTRIVIQESPSLIVDKESRRVMSLRRPENIPQAVIDKRNQDILDQKQEWKVMQDFIEN